MNMLEIVSTVLALLMPLLAVFVVAVYLIVWWRERNLPPEEKDRRMELRYGMDKKQARNWRYAYGFMVFAYLFVLGSIVFQSWQGAQQKYGQQFESSETSQTEQQTENIQQSTIDISTWQTYRNDEFGYQLQYPVGWNISKGCFDCTIPEEVVAVMRPLDRGGFGSAIVISVQHKDREPNFLFDALMRRQQEGGEMITIGGVEAWRDSGNEREIILERNGIAYEINIVVTNDNIIDQILSTFRFVESAESARKVITVLRSGEQGISQELQAEVPIYIDENTVQAWILDVNNDGKIEVVFTALQSLDTIPDRERYGPSAYEYAIERKKYVHLSTLTDEGEFESVGELIEVATGDSLLVDKVEDLNNDGKSEIVMKYVWVGASVVDIALVATVDMSTRQFMWLEMQTKEGQKRKVSLGTRDALTYAFWHSFEDANQDGAKEFIIYNVQLNHAAADIEDCRVEVYRWNGKLYEYDEVLSMQKSVEVGSTCGYRDPRG